MRTFVRKNTQDLSCAYNCPSSIARLILSPYNFFADTEPIKRLVLVKKLLVGVRIKPMPTMLTNRTLAKHKIPGIEPRISRAKSFVEPKISFVNFISSLWVHLKTSRQSDEAYLASINQDIAFLMEVNQLWVQGRRRGGGGHSLSPSTPAHFFCFNFRKVNTWFFFPSSAFGGCWTKMQRKLSKEILIRVAFRTDERCEWSSKQYNWLSRTFSLTLPLSLTHSPNLLRTLCLCLPISCTHSVSPTLSNCLRFSDSAPDRQLIPGNRAGCKKTWRLKSPLF